jgi:hypothetical protein
MRLSNIAKKIITERLRDQGTIIDESEIDNYIVDAESFADNNTMYNFVVENFGKLIIE